MKFVSKRLIEIRESLGINKAQAAKMLKMSAMGYGRYEKGEREPSYQSVCFIAKKFGTSSDYLYGLTDNPKDASITITLSEDPQLYYLVDAIKKNPTLANRLLTYSKELSHLK